MPAESSHHNEVELILGNSNPRFSGVTSTMLQVLRHQKKMTNVAVMGKYNLPKNVRCMSFLKTYMLCRNPLADGRPRVFHARRNNEAIQAFLLKKIFRAHLRFAFTSTAQRNHTWITRWLIRESDGVITTCTNANAYIEGGADIIIPHGIDISRYHPTENRASAWQELGYPGKYGIGIFGRVRPQKGVDVFVRALIPLLHRYPDFTVIICGETTPDQRTFEQELQTEIATAGLTKRFLFLGKQNFDGLPKLFRAMSIVTALSLKEGFGLTILEAMASGTAVLASEAGAWKEIIREGTDGFVVPCNDVEATTKQLDLMMGDHDALDKMGKNGRQRVEAEYTIKREASELWGYLKSLTEVDTHQ